MNAVLAERFAGGWHLGRAADRHAASSSITLIAEGALLFVAAQTGFIDGPRVMANMAIDSWLPHRFAALSDRLTTQNGVLLMGARRDRAAALHARQRRRAGRHVLDQRVRDLLAVEARHVALLDLASRASRRDWARHLPIHVIGLVLCVAILGVTIYEKFAEGGWLTLVDHRASWSSLCFAHPAATTERCGAASPHLDELFTRSADRSPIADEPGPVRSEPARPRCCWSAATAASASTRCSRCSRCSPATSRTWSSSRVGVIDSGTFKGASEVERLRRETARRARQIRGALAPRLGLSAEYRMAIGTDVVDEASKLCLAGRPRVSATLFFAGKLIFEQRALVPPDPAQRDRLSPSSTGSSSPGHAMVILPVRVRARELAESQAA